MEALDALLAGNKGEENPHIWSSDNWLLHEAGKYMRERGLSTPCAAKKSRGFSVKAETFGGNIFLVKFNTDLSAATVERK